MAWNGNAMMSQPNQNQWHVTSGGGGTGWGDSKEGATSDLQGYLQGIIDNSVGNPSTFRPGEQFDPLQSLWGYYTNGLKPEQLNQLTQNYYGQAQNNLYGQQQRAAGGAGALAANQAFASGASNPYAFSQHAQNGVYQNYAGAFGGLQGNYLQQMMQNPQIANNSQRMANEANFQNLYQLLALKGGLASQRSGSYGAALGAGLVGAGGQVGAAYTGAPKY